MDDSDDFEKWYRTTRPRLVRSLVVASGGNVDAATDAADEAFVRALERWKRVRMMDSPTAWAYRTGLNVLHRRFRRRATEVTALRTLLDTQGPDGDHDDSDNRALSRIELWDAVSGLGERERQAVALRYVGGLSESEIASAMKLSVGGASALLSRARRNLRRSLIDREIPVV